MTRFCRGRRQQANLAFMTSSGIYRPVCPLTDGSRVIVALPSCRAPVKTLGDAFLQQQRVLVVAPHPDDETLGCAGMIARVKALGGQAYVMIVSAGGIAQHGQGPAGQGCPVRPRRRASGPNSKTQ